MSNLRHKKAALASVELGEGCDRNVRRPVILAVGEIALWEQAGRYLESTSQLAFAEFADLSPELLQTLGPDVVVSPMITRSFDCLDLAQLLHQAAFVGRYRIVTPAMPNPRVLLSEIASLCPGLDVDVIALDTLEGTPHH